MAADRRLLALVLIGALAGCQGGVGAQRSDTVQAEVATGHAVVVVERDGTPPWRELHLRAKADGREFALRLEGDHYAIGVYQLPVGDYEIVKTRVYEWSPSELRDPIAFTLVEGKLNYLGEFELRRGSSGALYQRLSNHAGRLLTELRLRAPALIGRWPLVKVGEDNDDWTESAAPGR